jgi:hypothetical protein
MTMRFLVVLVALLAVQRVAYAQEAPVPEERPWAEGVPESEQQVALAAYDEGNAEFVESRFAQALAKYREAIAHWDHPAIRFNMAVCLINLDRPIEAREELERALAYGAAPFGAEVHQQGLTYRKLLDGQLAELTIHSDERDAEVTLDGALLFRAPGSVTSWVRPGLHQIVATKTGFLTRSDRITLAPGSTQIYDVRMVASPSPARTTRRWAQWKPYAVAGAGAVVAGIGGVAYALAARDYAAYDDGVRDACPLGCTGGDIQLRGPKAIRDRGDREQMTAFSLFAVGGALAIAGGVGLYLNQLHTEVIVQPGGGVLAVGVSF